MFNLNNIKKDLLIEKTLRGQEMKFYSTWGLFSPEKIDEGSELLINNIKVDESINILDLGCGYGAVGLTLAKSAPKSNVHLIDKDFVAVEYTKKNIKLNNLLNCQVYLSNGFDQIENKFDIIVSNIPAKVSKELFWIWFQEAKEHLSQNGSFYVVAVSGLKDFLKRNLTMVFGNCEKLAQSKTYSVFRSKMTTDYGLQTTD